MHLLPHASCSVPCLPSAMTEGRETGTFLLCPLTVILDNTGTCLAGPPLLVEGEDVGGRRFRAHELGCLTSSQVKCTLLVSWDHLSIKELKCLLESSLYFGVLGSALIKILTFQ